MFFIFIFIVAGLVSADACANKGKIKSVYSYTI